MKIVCRPKLRATTESFRIQTACWQWELPLCSGTPCASADRYEGMRSPFVLQLMAAPAASSAESIADRACSDISQSPLRRPYPESDTAVAVRSFHQKVQAEKQT